MKFSSRMAQETHETPDVVARFLATELQGIARLGKRLRGMVPPVVVTCARGSSDHAAGYLKYCLEIVLGVPVASLGPSLASVYDAPLQLGGTVMVTISQSGQSPDIVALQHAARRAGALTIAIVNVANSPVAATADVVVPLHCGEEVSVAATKTMLTSCVAVAAIVAEWADDAGLRRAVRELPGTLTHTLTQDWSHAANVIAAASSVYTLGRGPSLPMAAEAALKLKETASLHVEAFSFAEVMHGPLQLVTPGFPIIAFAQNDQSVATTRVAIDRLIAAGTRVFTAGSLDMPGTRLPAVDTGHGLTDPLAMLQSFYTLANTVALLRGYDPDRPHHLRKVTQTV